MTKGFKELLRLAKQEKVTTYDQLFNLSQQCVNEITGADFDSYLPRSIPKFSKGMHALVDGQRLQCTHLARP